MRHFQCTVVICFQIVSLTYWKTTRYSTSPATLWLWFAFKLYLWRIEKQPGSLSLPLKRSCDLLSNCIFDVLKNNKEKLYSYKRTVVICFQIVSLTYWKTTYKLARSRLAQLWFAFKLYLWRIEKQQVNISSPSNNRCDLLSNCIFDVLKNN